MKSNKFSFGLIYSFVLRLRFETDDDRILRHVYQFITCVTNFISEIIDQYPMCRIYFFVNEHEDKSEKKNT